MSLFTAYQTDTTAENDGTWIVGAFKGDIDVKIRSTHSAQAKQAQTKIDKRNRQYWQRGDTVPPDVQAKNEREMAVAVTVDWRGGDMVDDAAQPIPCTDAMKEQIFGDASMWEFRQQVLGAANNADNFRKAELAADAKNSSTSSGESSAPAATSPV